MFVWLSLFAATLVFGERGHIAVDVLAQRAPGLSRRVLVVAVQASTLAFAALGMVWGGLRGVAMSWEQVIPGFPFSVGHMYLALPVSGLMIAFLALEDLLLAVRGDELAPLEETDDEAAESAGAAAAAAVIQDSDGQSLPDSDPRTDTEKER
ncbi:TRAP transporter small permease [Brachybacterium sp. AOP42-C2-15]